MEKMYRNFAIGLVLLIILAPLGLLAVGETFGEWGSEELKEKLGFVPPGLEKLSGIWSAPMPDYAFPGGEGSESMTYRRGIHPIRSNRRSSMRWPSVFRRKEGCQRLAPPFYLISFLLVSRK